MQASTIVPVPTAETSEVKASAASRNRRSGACGANAPSGLRGQSSPTCRTRPASPKFGLHVVHSSLFLFPSRSFFNSPSASTSAVSSTLALLSSISRRKGCERSFLKFYAANRCQPVGLVLLRTKFGLHVVNE